METYVVVLFEVWFGFACTECREFKKTFTREQIMEVAIANNFEIVSDYPGLFITVRSEIPFYADGTKKVRYWQFMTAEAYKDCVEN